MKDLEPAADVKAEAAAETRPAVGGVLDDLLSAGLGGGLNGPLADALLPDEIKEIRDSLDDGFQSEDVWGGLERLARLGRKAERYLTGRPVTGAEPAACGVVAACAAAPTVTDGELVRQFDAAVADARPVVGGDGDAVPPGAVGMNPALAGLLVNLVVRAILKRLGK